MALLWQKTVGDKRYQVRRAGASIRLYTNGVFHSQFNPDNPFGGNIWDLLVLPALFKPAHIQRVLVLGLGGGAVVRTIQTFLPQRRITAVEIDPVHLHVAKTFFGVKPNKHTKLVRADAIAWLQNYSGAKFDFILDDLFIETNGLPDRANSPDMNWSNLLLKNLSPAGVLAINFDSPRALRQSTIIKSKQLAKQFGSRFSLSIPGYDNRIAALFKTSTTKTDLNQTLDDLARAEGRGFRGRLRMQLRKL